MQFCFLWWSSLWILTRLYQAFGYINCVNWRRMSLQDDMPGNEGSINSAYDSDSQQSSNHDKSDILHHYSMTLCSPSEIAAHCSPDGVRSDLSRSQELQHASNMSSSNSVHSSLSNKSLTSSALKVEVSMLQIWTAFFTGVCCCTFDSSCFISGIYCCPLLLICVYMMMMLL